MAWPRGTITLGRAFDRANDLILQIGQRAQTDAVALNSAITTRTLIGAYERYVATDAELNVLRVIPGLGQRAKDEFNDQNFNVGPEFTAIRNNITSVISAFEALNATGVVTATYSPTQTASLKTALETLATSTGL